MLDDSCSLNLSAHPTFDDSSIAWALLREHVAPFIKYTGGKGRLQDRILSYFPPGALYGYMEPFLGGGAMFWHTIREGRLHPSTLKYLRLSDRNADLMNLWVDVALRGAALATEVKPYLDGWLTDKTKTYYDCRTAWNANVDARTSAQQLFLRAAGFNGLWRVNAKGELNVPEGAYKLPTIASADRLHACGEALRAFASVQRRPAEDPIRELILRTASWDEQVQSLHCLVADTTEMQRRATVVYCDPPYLGTHSAYNAGGFPLDEHERLFEGCAHLDALGYHVVLSNSNSETTREFQKRHWPRGLLREFMGPRSNSCKTRHPDPELVVTSAR